MKHLVLAASIMLGVLPTAARGEVLDSGPNGFSLATEVTIAAPRADVWAAAVGEIGHWWNSEHTISGDAANLSIEPVAQGCFCEAIGAHASVVHLTVTFVNPGVMLRLTGGLGPLGLLGVNGNLVWEFFDVGQGTRVRFSYAVGGYRPGGLDTLAVPVDGVISEQLTRLKHYVEAGSPDADGG
ncbi:MAG: SRPBCC family protein [Woeseiaceae bacterium]